MASSAASSSRQGTAFGNVPTNGETALWHRWRDTQDEQARAQLLELHLPYARVVAASLFAKRYHDEIAFEEYHQLACMGLLEAMERFDPEGGAQFRSFAAIRMRGAILDGLERTTEKQQQIAARQRLEAQRRESLAGPAELAEKHKVTAVRTHQQVLEYVAEAGLSFALAWILDGSGMVRASEETRDIPFYQNTQLRQLRQRILELVRALPASQQKVIRGHYLQEQPFEAIATQMGLSRGRISQLHKSGIERLRDLMREPALFDITL